MRFRSVSKISNRSRTKEVAVTAECVGIVCIVPLTGVAMASTQNPTAYRIASFLGIEKNLQPYETVLNTSVTKSDVTLALKGAIIDRNELVVSVVTQSDAILSENFTAPGGTVYINGEEINKGSSGEIGRASCRERVLRLV